MSKEWEAYCILANKDIMSIFWVYSFEFQNHGAAWFAILTRREFEGRGSRMRDSWWKTFATPDRLKHFCWNFTSVCKTYRNTFWEKKIMLWWRHRWRQYFSEFRVDQTIGIFSDLNFYKLYRVKILIKATSWKNMKPCIISSWPIFCFLF